MFFGWQDFALVHESLPHRPEDPGLAQGPDLPAVPANSLCIFAGHAAKWKTAQDTFGRNYSALVTGCSAWHKARKLGERFRGADIFCMCGLRCPSWPHLVWSCPATATQRGQLVAPV